MHLSSYNTELINRLPELVQFEKSTSLPSYSGFLHDYDWPLSSWPLIISKQRVNDIESTFGPLKQLIHKAVPLFFNGDVQRFSEYFSEPDYLYRQLVEIDPNTFNTTHKDNFIIRYDGLISENIFKFVEINSGSSLGGWKHDFFSARYQTKIKYCNVTKHWPIQYRYIIDSFFSGIYQAACRTLDRKVINLCMNAEDDREGVVKHLSMVPSIRNNPNFNVMFYDNPNDFKFMDDHSVIYKGKKIDAVILVDHSVRTRYPSFFYKLTASSNANNIYFPDNPLYTFIGNKQMFALLHDQELHSKLTDAEVEFINKHIPWSMKLSGESVSYYEGKAVTDMTQFLMTHQDNMVLKKGKSLQGNDVVVGRFITPEQWQASIENAISSGEWLVQEYYAPDPVEGIGENNHSDLYDIIWGVYDFNSRYCGNSPKACPSNRGDGVITGGKHNDIQFCVFEEV